MAMSRKHYSVIASVIDSVRYVTRKRYQPNCSEISAVDDALWVLADKLSVEFKIDNSAFNRGRFMAACGFRQVTAEEVIGNDVD